VNGYKKPPPRPYRKRIVRDLLHRHAAHDFDHPDQRAVLQPVHRL
jgi:hypothetical protein